MMITLAPRDLEFFQNFLTNLEQVLSAAPHLLIGVKDINSQAVLYSQSYANFLGIELSQILGKTTVLPLYDDPTIEQVIINEDQQVIKNQQQLRLLKINKINHSLKPYICLKSPLINPQTQQVVGILLQGLEISIVNLNQLITNSYSTLNKQPQKDKQLPSLSRRERQVIFLFMAQLTSQEIAEVIYHLENKKISKSTIDSLFNDQLYPKFQVHNRSALYTKLQQLNFDKLIPSELLSSMSIPLATINSF